MLNNKLIFFLYSMDGGGAEKSFMLISNKAVELNYDVTVLLVKKKGAYLNNLNKRIKIKEFNKLLNKIGLLGKFIYFMYFLYFILL